VASGEGNANSIRCINNRMDTFKKFLEERFVNLLHADPRKQQYADEVHGMVQKSYEKIGGIHGSGFRDPHDMVKNIPMWKLKKKGGKIVSAVFYKDREGRKSVAAATDGSEEGKKGVGEIFRDDLKRGRAYGEKSKAALSFTKRIIGADELHKHVVPYHEVSRHLGGEEIRRPPEDDVEIQKHPEYKEHFYQRKIGGEWHTKLMLGKPGMRLK
jgi:hypothetical protein